MHACLSHWSATADPLWIDVYIDFSSHTTPNINTIRRKHIVYSSVRIYIITRHSQNIIHPSDISLVVKPYIIVMRRTTPHADATAQECDGTRLIIKTILITV